MSVKGLADNVELKRRIRSLLGVIRSIAVHMQFHGRDSGEAARHLAGRVRAIGRAALHPTAAGMDLECLVRDELLVHCLHRAEILINGPAVRLSGKSAQLISLVIHELATNSVKFGALRQPQTQLRVLWWFTGPVGSRLRLEWAESGVRLASGKRIKPGFGSQVIKRLIASELRGNGELLFSNEGVLCTIEFPAAEAQLQND